MIRAVKVGVTCVGGYFIFDLLRAFREAEGFKVTLVGLDANPKARGRPLVDRFEVVPHAGRDPAGFIDCVAELSRRLQLDAFVPLSEAETRAVAQHRAELEAIGVALSVSGAETVARMTDKLHMLEHLQKAGVDVGPFAPVDTEAEAMTALSALGYPEQQVVFKPRRGTGSRAVLIADATVDGYTPLLETRFCGIGPMPALVGEMAARGVGFAGFLATPFYGHKVYDVDCVARAGKAIDIVPRLREYENPLSPTNEGCVVDLHPAVIDLVELACAAFEVHGACDFDVAVDAGGTPRLLDASCRLSGSVGASLGAGVNFPAQLLRVMFDLPPYPYTVQDGSRFRPFHHIVRVDAGCRTATAR